MKIRRADKRYQARHGATGAAGVLQRAGDFGQALGWLSAIAVVGVTGYFFHDDVLGRTSMLTDGTPASLTAAGWAIVVVSGGTAAACLFAATQLGLKSQALLLSLFAVAAVAAIPALWFFPGANLAETFDYVNPTMLAGTGWGWLTLMVSGCIVGLSNLLQVALRVTEEWNRRWQLGTGAAIAAVAGLILAGVVAYA